MLSCVVHMLFRTVIHTRCHHMVVRRCWFHVVVVGAHCTLYVVAAIVCGVAARCVLCVIAALLCAVVFVGCGGGCGDTELTQCSFFGRCGHTTATYPHHGFGFCMGLDLATHTHTR